MATFRFGGARSHPLDHVLGCKAGATSRYGRNGLAIRGYVVTATFIEGAIVVRTVLGPSRRTTEMRASFLETLALWELAIRPTHSAVAPKVDRAVLACPDPTATSQSHGTMEEEGPQNEESRGLVPTVLSVRD